MLKGVILSSAKNLAVYHEIIHCVQDDTRELKAAQQEALFGRVLSSHFCYN